MPEYIRWLRGSLAGGAFSEDEILVPARLGPSQAIVIHSFQVEVEDWDPDADADLWEAQLTAKSCAAMIGIDEEELIEKVGVHHIESAAGAAEHEITKEVNRYPRILYPFTKMFVGGKSTPTTVINYRIGYTIRNTRKEQIFDDMYQYRFNP